MEMRLVTLRGGVSNVKKGWGTALRGVLSFISFALSFSWTFSGLGSEGYSS